MPPASQFNPPTCAICAHRHTGGAQSDFRLHSIFAVECPRHIRRGAVPVTTCALATPGISPWSVCVPATFTCRGRRAFAKSRLGIGVQMYESGQHGGRQLPGDLNLADDGVRPQLARTHIVVEEFAHDNDGDCGIGAPNQAACFEAIDLGHGDVGDDDIRQQFSDSLQQFLTVVGYGNHVHMGLEDPRERGQDGWVVVSNDNARALRHGISRSPEPAEYTNPRHRVAKSTDCSYLSVTTRMENIRRRVASYGIYLPVSEALDQGRSAEAAVPVKEMH